MGTVSVLKTVSLSLSLPLSLSVDLVHATFISTVRFERTILLSPDLLTVGR